MVPFGANLDELPAGDIWTRRAECSLVFVGVTWFEKGADVAVEAARILRSRGVPVVLHVVGVAPPEGLPEHAIRQVPRLPAQADPGEYARLTALVATADFLILPTRFDAFGIVFCEAAAYGTPSIARQTGRRTDRHRGRRDRRAAAAEGRPVRRTPTASRRSGPTRLATSGCAATPSPDSRSTLNWDAWGAQRGD